MAITTISGSINTSSSGADSVQVVSQLGDRPNQDDHLSASGLKAKFDSAAVTIGNFINNTIKAKINEIIGVVNKLTYSVGSAGVLKIDGSGNVSSGTIGATNIASKAVTTAKIDDGAVAAGQLAADAVETAKIKNNAVTNSKMAQNSVSAYNIQSGAVVDAKVGDNVRVIKIGTTTPTTSDISNGQIYLKYS